MEVEPRRKWPTGLPAVGVDLKGRIPVGDQDAPARPVGVVSITSHTPPQLIQSLAERIAAIGRMPLLGTFSYHDTGVGTRVPRTNSAQRLRALHGALTVPPALAAASPRPTVRCCWSTT